MHFTKSFVAIVHIIFSFLAILQFIELCDVKLSMLGHHQLKNAATATCAALCLRGQGEKLWNCQSDPTCFKSTGIIMESYGSN